VPGLGGLAGREEPDEGLAAIAFLVQGQHLLCLGRSKQPRIDGAEDATGHRRQVGDEKDVDRTAGHLGQLLLHFGLVLVPPHLVGGQILVGLGVMKGGFGTLATARDAGLAVDDD